MKTAEADNVKSYDAKTICEYGVGKSEPVRNESTDPRHTVMHIKTVGGSEFALDISGAQFGFPTENIVTPWSQYEARCENLQFLDSSEKDPLPRVCNRLESDRRVLDAMKSRVQTFFRMEHVSEYLEKMKEDEFKGLEERLTKEVEIGMAQAQAMPKSTETPEEKTANGSWEEPDIPCSYCKGDHTIGEGWTG